MKTNKPQKHKFTLTVKGFTNKKYAKLVILSNFSQRKPDGLKFFLK